MRNRDPHRGSLHYELMERDNDAQLASLHSQVAGLKSLTLDIEAEVKAHNDLLSDMDKSFGGAGDLLKTTMAKLGKMLDAGGSRHMWYLVAFIVLIFILLWTMTGR
ncbi:hypothetical protein CTAYLR_000429 [Chrysophaeum taylorii]|uniref:t-SNARE coiled-coil homology domain-containing protein n=1 Tax=Chrysophaeum taylorii TaxID=2483200 RepID=A0AAD7XMX8_9STRA|nr:hypothetical protein CTAYLR_000429 [Chrysophaeum taylorii]